MTPNPRSDRAVDELRTITFERGAVPYAEGSCMITTGNTRVLCTASVELSLPPWKKGATSGWLTAEYSMLPRATHTRNSRERSKLGGRTQEIQRLIGRALRSAVDLDMLGPRTILVDCDVLVADGGTRTAAITGAAVAVHDACAWLMREGHIGVQPMRQLVAATSVGIIDGEPRLDLEYSEDVRADVDMNIVAMEDGGLVEVQGTAEHNPFTRTELDSLMNLGTRGIEQLIALQRAALR
jgi:ribonuclease PH